MLCLVVKKRETNGGKKKRRLSRNREGSALRKKVLQRRVLGIGSKYSHKKNGENSLK